MIQNWRLDKKIGNKIWVERVFITGTLRSRPNAFVRVLEIEGYNI